MAAARGGLHRSVELSFSNPVPDTLVEIDNIRLTDAKGRNLIRNGDFSRGHDRWFYTTDDAVPWRVENVWLQIFFEQGLFGVVVFTALLGVVLWQLWKQARAGQSGAYVVMMSLIGFITVGLFGSVLESPRLMLLFYMTLFVVLLSARAGVKRFSCGGSLP